jgi:O-antigen ligase
MTDAAQVSFIGRAFDRTRLMALADWLAVAVAVTLPWSTTAAEIFIVLWLLVLLPTLDVALIRRELSSAAGGLPALLWVLAALGMLWAHVGFAERLGGLGGFHRLLIVPLLLAQFRRSEHGDRVLQGFLASCVALLAVSWTGKILAMSGVNWLTIPNKATGIVVKDYIAQSAEFFVCAFALLALAIERARGRQIGIALASAAVAVLFLANIYFISTGRTALVVVPVLLVIFGFRFYGWKGIAGAIVVAVLLFAVAWPLSPFLRQRVNDSFADLQKYQADNSATFTGMRVEFLKNAARFVAEAPVIGHGTGSMPELFRRASEGKSGAAGVVSVNPHNQFLAVAIQLGLIGGAILIAMWVAHLALFRGAGLVAWLGVVMVVQNVVSSMFNSHLFDFFHGWLYVFGVGVLGGMVRRARARSEDAGEGS